MNKEGPFNKTLEGIVEEPEEVVETPEEQEYDNKTQTIALTVLTTLATAAILGTIAYFGIIKPNQNQVTPYVDSQTSIPTAVSINPTLTSEPLPSTKTYTPTEVPTSVPTKIPTKAPTKIPTQELLGPFREHYTVSTGTGPMSIATTSDGMHPFTEAWLWQNGHHDIQLINPDEHPNGCGIAKYDVDKIWVSTSVLTGITVAGEFIGTLYKTNSHGYLFDYDLKKGQEICFNSVGSGGYSIIIGPDIDFHYDSYCYRWGCQ